MENNFGNEKVIESLRSVLLSRQRRRKDRETFGDSGSSLMPFYILYGVPGCGKTHLVRELCSQLNLHLYELQADSAHQPYVGQGEQRIRQHFEEARDLAAEAGVTGL